MTRMLSWALCDLGLVRQFSQASQWEKAVHVITWINSKHERFISAWTTILCNIFTYSIFCVWSIVSVQQIPDFEIIWIGLTLLWTEMTWRYLPYATAFNTVNHDILLQCLGLLTACSLRWRHICRSTTICGQDRAGVVHDSTTSTSTSGRRYLHWWTRDTSQCLQRKTLACTSTLVHACVDRVTSSISAQCFAVLRQLRTIRPFILLSSMSFMQTLVTSLVLSRLDYFYGLPASGINWLQIVHNAASRRLRGIQYSVADWTRDIRS
jgi:hypothetical protein